MKKISYILLTMNLWVFIACKGDKGDVGPKGDIGATGPTGLSATAGPKGAMGDKGETGTKGATGATGDTGATPSLKTAYTDWVPMSNWTVATVTDNNYYVYNAKDQALGLGSLFPSNENFAFVNTASEVYYYVIENYTTKVPVGRAYLYFQIKNSNNEIVVFSGSLFFGTGGYKEDKMMYKGSTLGFFEASSSKIKPQFSTEFSQYFSKQYFKSTDDFITLSKNSEIKMRAIFIPLDLTTKGRIASMPADISYEEITKIFGIAEKGAKTY